MESNKKVNILEFVKKILNGEYDLLLNKLWYLVIIFLSSIYVWNYRDKIFTLDKITAAHIIRVLWLIVLLVPIFSEMELFGFKFKKEIKKIDEQVKEIKTSILTMQMQSTTNLYNYYPGQLPSNEKRKLQTEVTTNYPRNYPEDYFRTDDNTLYLFSVRRKFEEILNSIAFKSELDFRNSEGMYVNTPTLLRRLYQKELIDAPIYNALREIFAICNRAVHGNDVIQNDVDFVKNTAPNCLSILLKVQDSL